MCGIHLIVDKRKKLSDNTSINNMMLSGTHRGPDNQSIISVKENSANYYFASNQLFITDDSAVSTQPFFNPENNNILLYNGEIYNYHELKKKYLGDQLFRTNSDTEVLFHLLNQTGVSSLPLLNGMFALCFYSKKDEKVILARDSSGIKPLYYYENEDYFIVSSEIRSILSSKLVNSEINPSAVTQYLQFRHCQYPQTFYKDIYELPPGSFWEFNLSGNSRVHDFSYSDEEKKNVGFDLINQKLSDSVSRHLMGMETPALCLSGGIDSTLLLAKIHEFQPEGYPVYCTYFADQKINSDFEYAKKASKLFNAEFNYHKVEIECMDRFDEFVDSMDQPVGDSGAFATMLLTEEIAKNHKSALSGAGADELFGGYNRHLFYYKYLKNPAKYRSLGKVINTIPRLVRSKGEFIRLLEKLSDSIGQNPYDTYNRIVSFTRIESSCQLPDWKMHNEMKHKNLNEAFKYDRSRYLVSDILAISDKMSMKNNLELRTPYLDNELVSVVNQLNPEFILKNGRKWILKNILKKYPGTSEIINRRKKGYGLPFDQWVSLNPNNIFGFLENKGHFIFQFVDRQLIYDLYKDHLKGRKNNVLELWNIAVLARWLENSSIK